MKQECYIGMSKLYFCLLHREVFKYKCIQCEHIDQKYIVTLSHLLNVLIIKSGMSTKELIEKCRT